ncbi:hypothetical protein NPIL_202871, partial [Nephila pilipes]
GSANLSRPGVKATIKVTGGCFVLSSLYLAKWPDRCVPCQRDQIKRNSVSLHETYLVSCPLPSSRCYAYVLTCADTFSSWPKTLSLKITKHEAVAFDFNTNWIWGS